MVPARGAVVATHALLYHRPLAFAANEEAVMIDAKAILNRCRIDLRRHTTVVGEALPVDADALTVVDQFVRSAPRDFPFPAGDENPEVTTALGQTLLESAADRCRDPARVPVETEHAAERLEPIRVGKPLEEFRAAVLQNDDLRDSWGKLSHTVKKPPRSLASVKRKCSATSALGHKQIYPADV